MSVRPEIIFRTHIHPDLPPFLLLLFFFFNISPYQSSPTPQTFCIFSYHQFLPIKCCFFQPETDFWRIGGVFLGFFISLSLLPSPNAIAVHFARVSWADCLSCHHFTMWADEVFRFYCPLGTQFSKVNCGAAVGSFVWSSLRIWGQLDSLDFTSIIM